MLTPPAAPAETYKAMPERQALSAGQSLFVLTAQRIKKQQESCVYQTPNPVTLAAFLDRFAAFFSFGVMAACFLASLLLFCSLLMVCS